jgi:glycosyltransferase involved in cell wall biosynthesis
MKKKILVSAPILTASGYGEQARFAIRALRSREDLFDVYIIATPWGNCGWVHEDSEERMWIDSMIMKNIQYSQACNGQPQYDMTLQISIPNEWKKIAPINIGYTAGIETNKISPHWIQPSNQMDKIIVVSNFAKKGFENGVYTVQDQATGQQIPNFKTTTPIEVVNYPVRKSNPAEVDLHLTTDFNFLVVAQGGPRKNLVNTIKWFVEEFKNDANVGLICKTHLGGASQMDREAIAKNLNAILNDHKGRKCKVYLLHGDMNEQEMAGLYTHPKVKALVSLSHGEGFGLPVFEAAYWALPVITTEWSGPTDFMYCPNKEGKIKPHFARVEYTLQPVQPEAVWGGVIEKDTMWAFPVENAAKTQMREVYKNHDRFRGQAKRLASHIEKEFEENKMYDQFVEKIYGKKIEKLDLSKLPKISLITSVFNASEHIDGLMEDVTRQTIFNDKCEWIILNANPQGKDYEEEVILKYAEKYPNIVYKRLENDHGIYAVWNQAIKMATGEYITNINCDDRRSPDCIEKQASMLFVNGDAELVYNDSYITQTPNTVWENIDKSTTQRYNFEQFSKEAMLRGNLPHNNPMWKKSLHDKYGFFNEQYRSASDWEFWLKCSFGGSKFIKADEVLGIYYFNPTGMSTNPENNVWKRKEEKEVFTTYVNKMKAGG